MKYYINEEEVKEVEFYKALKTKIKKYVVANIDDLAEEMGDDLQLDEGIESIEELKEIDNEAYISIVNDLVDVFIDDANYELETQGNYEISDYEFRIKE